ncbi:SLAP domain-containing protein [Salirhabdus euzebyi]|uniref:SLAP domain-containing protein n=1 Tax=Salirhabdus euzebyi TaxID=394506 RepID=A0A841Q6K1_9BACI|nr:SLAP domain-containing protein [Salirhabdus euzebyi]MBB6453984.1 SLAP domain-containing protein [Salirhabdus euzebyi]
MKKLLFSLMFLLAFSLLIGCSDKEASTDAAEEKSNEQVESADTSAETTEETDAEEAQDATEDEETTETTETTEEAATTTEETIPVYQLYDFGPTVDASTIDQATKDQIQLIVNELGDPAEGIQFNGIGAGYLEDGTLQINVLVRNGYDHKVWGIDAELKVTDSNGEEIIAAANFSFPEEDFGVLNPGSSRFWSLYFGPEFVFNPNFDLTNYMIDSNYTYSY